MKNLPPYTMRYPVAGLLEIRVRPRIFFPLLVLGIMLPLFLFRLFFSVEFKAFWRMALRVFGTDFANEEAEDIYNTFPVFSALSFLLLGSWLVLHKRIGLIQVTREGVRIFRNPHFLPRSQVWIPRAEIKSLRDEKLASRNDDIGYVLQLETHSLGNFELVRIFGSGNDDRQRFGQLGNEIRRVLGGIG
ncbi:MAG TPA: hypothetical protein PKM44_03670 [Turneriella sp.]|nr:hypothetical protein [Turneriella sp.]HMY10041.1 hypothetical protein [Turneriella sp.]HNE19135.1 hypothetical protein [Turneriella sp.]HNJ66488.1 hypothetical protein [Turneriella sp.]HNL09586.1 hypothetical protein [Turneriella sp.]